MYKVHKMKGETKMIKKLKKYIAFCFVILMIFQITFTQNVYAKMDLWPSIKCNRCWYTGIFYGEHNNTNNHNVYEWCTSCHSTGSVLYTAKFQDCNLCNTSTNVNILNLSRGITLNESDTDFKLQIAVSDNSNRTLQCIYVLNENSSRFIDDSGETSYINNTNETIAKDDELKILKINQRPEMQLAMLDSRSFGVPQIPKQEASISIDEYECILHSKPEIVENTIQTKIVTFTDGFNARELKKGLNKITIKVQVVEIYSKDKTKIICNPNYETIVDAYFYVDADSPIIRSCSATSTQNSVNISTQVESLNLPIQYRYTFNSNVSNWLTGKNSYTIGNLNPNTIYSYKVEAKDNKGKISLPYKGTISTKAQTPVLSAQSGNNNSIKINISDSNPFYSQYLIKVGNNYVSKDGKLLISKTWLSLPTKNITVVGLTGNTEYTITAYVKDKNNGSEVASANLNVKTTPLAPINLRCLSRTKNTINLAWDISVGAYVYDILREKIVNGSVVETKQIDNIMTSSYLDTGLLENQLYRYKIRSKSDLNTYGNWGEKSFDISTMPKEPTKVENLKADVKPLKVALSWKAQTDVVGYEILLNQQQKYYTRTNQIDIPFTEANTQYLMKVRAFNVYDFNNPGDTTKWNNQGAWSEEIICYTLSNPPKNIEITNLTFDKVQLTWDKNNNPDSVAYKCYLYKENNLIYETSQINTITYSFSGLEPQAKYTVKIYSINSSGIKSLEAEQGTFTTKIAPPEAPKQLRASAKDKEITLSWDHSERAKSYTIKRNNLVIAENILDNKFFDKELTPDTIYTYDIIALNESGEAIVQIIQKTKIQAPLIPSEINFERNNTYIKITWNSVDGVEGYDIKCDGKIYNTDLNTIFEHNGLNPGTIHTYSVRARNTQSKSQWSEPISVLTMPIAPITPDGIELTASSTKIFIKWGAVCGAESYVIDIDGIEIKDIKTLEYTYSFDSLLENDSLSEEEQEHIIKIKAVNEGGESGYSAPRSIVLLPNKENIPELTGKIEGQGIHISWNNIENVLSYQIEIDNVIATTVSAITTEHIDLEPDLTQSHTYRVRAVFEEIVGTWSYPVIIKSIPVVPGQFIGISGQNNITLNWSKCDTASTYELSADGNIIYIGPNTEFIHSSLPDDFTHTYAVRAANGSGYSQWSESISVTTNKETTNAPQNIKTLISNNTILVSWDLVNDAKGYMVKINNELKDVNISKINVATTPGGIYAVSVAAVFDYENNTLGEWSEEVSFMGLLEIPEVPAINEIKTTAISVELIWDTVSYAQGYEIEIDGNKIVKTYTNKYLDTDVLPETMKSYRIRSYNESGKSKWSEVIYATTNETLPGAPVNLLCKDAVATSGSAISIKWNIIEEATSYEITDGDNNIYSCENAEMLIDGLKSGALYQFKVRALTNAGQGPWSSVAYYITDIPMPKNLVISNSGNLAEDNNVLGDNHQAIKLNWEKSDGANSYDIEVDGVVMASTKDNEIILNLSSYMTHSFRIRALNEIKIGDWTEVTQYNSNIPVTVDVEENEEFSITMPVSNIQDLSQYRMTIVINTDELKLIDVCEFTHKKELSTNYIKDNNLQIIVENKNNFCYITIFTKNDTVNKISGIVNSIIVKGKKNCLSEIRYIVDKFQ